MTIKLIVKNDDSRENAIVEVKRVLEHGGIETVKKLKGGESTDVYIHEGVQVTIDEIQNG